jgi:hypothetical protein
MGISHRCCSVAAVPLNLEVRIPGRIIIGRYPRNLFELISIPCIGSWTGDCRSLASLGVIPERELGLHLFPKLILVVELPNTNNWTN